jgi:hypothetical protein
MESNRMSNTLTHIACRLVLTLPDPLRPRRVKMALHQTAEAAASWADQIVRQMAARLGLSVLAIDADLETRWIGAGAW